MFRRALVVATSSAVVAVGLLVHPGAVEAVEPRATPYPVIAAVGDIACKNPPAKNRQVCQYDDVSAGIAAGNYDAFLALGDDQYEYGAYTDFVQNYDVYFGRLNEIARPVPGNHEYGTPGARGYFRYFGALAHGPGGYYSYDLGAWHIVALNSAVCPPATGCAPGDPQYAWLKQDLAANDALCTLAYWHHPRFDWLKYQNADWTEDYELLRSKPFWDLLSADHADVVLAGHNHNYSRWFPMDADGNYDAAGMRQFIVGTGGRNLNNLGSVSTQPATFERGWAGGFGFLRMRLKPSGYDWKFMPAPGQPEFVDAGSGTCH